jgi:hypothetical protein
VTVANSSGPAQLDPGPSFGTINLLHERIQVHERNLRRSREALRALAITLVLSASVLPLLWVAGSRAEGESRARAIQAKTAKKGLDQMKAQVVDLTPAHSYLARLDAARVHLGRWHEFIALLEAGAGPGGFVSNIALRASPGTIDVDLHGEAISLAAANDLRLRLRRRQDTRDLRVTSIRPAEVLDSKTGAVQYQVRGKIKLK